MNEYDGFVLLLGFWFHFIQLFHGRYRLCAIISIEQFYRFASNMRKMHSVQYIHVVVSIWLSNSFIQNSHVRRTHAHASNK